METEIATVYMNTFPFHIILLLHAGKADPKCFCLTTVTTMEDNRSNFTIVTTFIETGLGHGVRLAKHFMHPLSVHRFLQSGK